MKTRSSSETYTEDPLERHSLVLSDYFRDSVILFGLLIKANHCGLRQPLLWPLNQALPSRPLDYMYWQLLLCCQFMHYMELNVSLNGMVDFCVSTLWLSQLNSRGRWLSSSSTVSSSGSCRAEVPLQCAGVCGWYVLSTLHRARIGDFLPLHKWQLRSLSGELKLSASSWCVIDFRPWRRKGSATWRRKN